MKQPPTNICPLRALAPIGATSGGPASCIEDRCAWFRVDLDPEDGTCTGECAVERIAAALTGGKAVDA